MRHVPWPPLSDQVLLVKFQSTHKCHGTSIAEFPVMLWVVFILVFFPLLDLCMLGLSYGSCWYLHYLLSRNAAIYAEVAWNGPNGSSTPTIINMAAQNDPYLSSIETTWASSGIGQFVHPQSTPTCTVKLITTSGTQLPMYIQTITSVTVTPFLNIPFPATVPGLNSNMTFSFSNNRVAENTVPYYN